jgi:hypothetical protein
MKPDNIYNSVIAANGKKIIPLLIIVISVFLTACIDDSPVKYNTFSIGKITTPVKGVSNTNPGKKVYIGHSLPVNIEVTATYADDNVPVQVYLLNVNDVEAVEAGNADINDIRFYYCQQTDETKIGHIDAGKKSYGIVINIPAGQSKDDYTGDYKTGTFYVLGDIDKYDGAETDIYKVYQKYKDNIDPDNTIVIASDYMSKPDLSVESMNFTGTTDAPQDSVTFYDLDLSKLPGAQNTKLGTIYLKPSDTGRSFTGSVSVKSSSSDALNVPVRFSLEAADSTNNTTVSIPLEIYDKTMAGFVDEYYIPILRKNTTETISLKLRIPDDKDGTYFSAYGTSSWSQTSWDAEASKATDYPLFLLRYQMDKMTAASTKAASTKERTSNTRSYSFKIKAVVNPENSITEARFIVPNTDNSAYDNTAYITDGTNATVLNNSKTEAVTIAVAAIDVKPNEGTKFYPCSVIGTGDCKLEDLQRQLVIWWGGVGAMVGNKNINAGVDIYMGLMFQNYSLISWGLGGNGYIGDFLNTGTKIIDIKSGFGMNFTAESHPFEASKSYYEFLLHTAPFNADINWVAEGNARLYAFKDSNTGFGEFDISTPITVDMPSISFDTEIIGIGVNVEIKTGLLGLLTMGVLPPIQFNPRTKISLIEDGSLKYDLGGSIMCAGSIELGADAMGLASIGGSAELNIFTLDLWLQFHTTTYYNENLHKGKVKGSIGIGGPEISLTGPQGALKVYFQILGIKVEQPIFSFQAFKLPLYDGVYSESEKTNWVDVAAAGKINYQLEGLNTSDDAF